MITKLQSLKGITGVKFHQKVSDYYDQTNCMRKCTIFQFEDLLVKVFKV